VHAALFAAESNPKAVEAGIQLQSYGSQDKLVTIQGPRQILLPGETIQLEWQVPDLDGAPIAEVGVFLSSDEPSEGVVHLDYLSWNGLPIVTFRRPSESGRMWKRQWINAADGFENEFGEAFRVIQNRGRGLVITGTREWTDYSVRARITPHLAKAFGLAICVQGLERYYGLLLSNLNTIKLMKRLDGERVLAEKAFDWKYEESYDLRIAIKGGQISVMVDREMFKVEDSDHPLSGGGIALICEEGYISTQEVLVRSESELG
jgi:hypothetical protein